VRNTFGSFALIQRCQVRKGRNIIERLDPSLHAGVKKVLRQAWDSPRLPSRPSGFSGIWLVGSITMPLASRLQSAKGWTKCSP
jgi:hypothetical protein